MLTSIEGVYRDGKIELTELPGNVPDETRVIVTFVEPSRVDLRAHGIDETQAAKLRGGLKPFANDRDNPEMDIYNDYDAAKSNL